MLSMLCEVCHSLDLGGRPLLVGKGRDEVAVAQGALAIIGRQPGVLRARHLLRGPPPSLQRLCLPLRGLDHGLVARMRSANGGSSRRAFLRAEQHTPACARPLDAPV
jgi:hypothetical protein